MVNLYPLSYPGGNINFPLAPIVIPKLVECFPPLTELPIPPYTSICRHMPNAHYFSQISKCALYSPSYFWYRHISGTGIVSIRARHKSAWLYQGLPVQGRWRSGPLSGRPALTRAGLLSADLTGLIDCLAFSPAASKGVTHCILLITSLQHFLCIDVPFVKKQYTNGSAVSRSTLHIYAYLSSIQRQAPFSLVPSTLQHLPLWL